jgi:hypothetical protein
VFLDLEPGVIGAVRASPLGKLFRPGNLVNQNAGADSNWAKAHYKKGWARISLNPPAMKRPLYKYSQSPTVAGHVPRFVCGCGVRAFSLCSYMQIDDGDASLLLGV